MSRSGGRRVLLVEDSPGDRELVSRSIAAESVSVELEIACDGEEALAALSPDAEAALPDLVLLDLNLPDLPGREILKHLRSHPALLSIPVVVLTTSDSRKDLEECYRLGCNGYLIKPESFRDYARLLAGTCHYWLDLVGRPAAEARA